jgi:DedD protein
MNRLLDPDTDLREDSHATGDHEISLGIPTILGIFFALALVCAAFFGFGYSLGHKSSQNAATTASITPSSPSITLKPAAGSLANQPAYRPAAETVSEPTPTPSAVTVPLAPPKNDPTTNPQPAASNPQPASTAQPTTSNPQPATTATGNFMVQIAAVSSQEIADIEVAALKKYGYDVVTRHEPQDQLLHIQIGPFTTRKDADAMRANVQAHGFNAYIVK